MQHRRIDHMAGLVAAQHVGQGLHHIGAAQQANLDDLRLQVVDDGLHLLPYNRGRQVVELLDAQRCLHRDGGDGRHRPSA